MSYNNKFVLCVLVNGVPQKELANGECHVPFGSTFSLRLRNRHNRNAAVQIFIDGENVSGEGYKVPANDKIDIHRYINKDVTFKFVDLESTEAIEHGKNGPNPDKVKGLIEARFFLEKEVPQVAKIENHYHYYKNRDKSYPTYYSGSASYCSGPIAQHDTIDYFDCCKSNIVPDYEYSRCCSSAPITPPVSEGATVEGHAPGQRFKQIHMELEPDYVSVKLFLKGFHRNNEQVSVINETHQPVGDNYCTRCSMARKDMTTNYCGRCGNKFG